MTDAPPIPDRRPLYRFWAPRYWPLWLGLGLLRVATVLPLRVQQFIGRLLGRLAMPLLRERRNIARINLELCFPALPAPEIQALLRRHFESLGMFLLEIGLSLWASDARISRLVTLHGVEHLRSAMAGGRGVILLSGHFAAMELTGRAMNLAVPQIAGLYRPNKNPFIDELLNRGRSRSVRMLVPKDKMRQMLRALKSGLAMWFAPDQSQRGKQGELVPFFGVPAMTNVALTQIVRLSGSPVVPYLPRRRPDGSGYDVEIRPALTGFPGESPQADALRINQLLEQHIREAPEQYYWVHRRFKNRPPPHPDPYG